jgi:hypothetical protein
MNHEIIKELGLPKTFSFESVHLKDTSLKKEIRHIIYSNFFCLDDYLSTEKMCHLELNLYIEKLRHCNQKGFLNLYGYNMPGIGPGELMLYVLNDHVSLGGGTSAGLDIIHKDQGYEAKAAKHKKSLNGVSGSFYSDFRLGGTVDTEDIMPRLRELAEVEKNEISNSKMEAIRERYPIAYSLLEDKFRQVCTDYFTSHSIVLFNNSNNKLIKGKIAFIGNIKPEQIYLDRVSSNSIKPAIGSL